MIRKTLSMARKETRHISRSPGTLFLVAASPVVMLVLMAYALAADIKSVPIAVLDKDLSPLSRRYVREITSGPDLNLVGYVESREEINELFDHDRIRAAIIIQPGFESEVTRLESFPVQILVDGSEPHSGGFAYQHILASTAHFIENVLGEAAASAGMRADALQAPIDLRMRVWYNPNLSAVQDVIPALIAVILGLPAVSMAAAVAREKEHGSLEQLIASPITRFEILAGKMLPYIIVGVFDVFLSLLTANVLFGTHFRGSILLLLLFSIDYFVANIAIGLLISIYSNTQQTAMTLAIMVFLFPGFFLSGIFFPLIAMPPEARLEANLLPTTQFVTIMRGLFLKGVGMDVLWVNGVVLLVMGILFGGFAVLRFQKKLA